MRWIQNIGVHKGMEESCAGGILASIENVDLSRLRPEVIAKSEFIIISTSEGPVQCGYSPRSTKCSMIHAALEGFLDQSKIYTFSNTLASFPDYTFWCKLSSFFGGVAVSILSDLQIMMCCTRGTHLWGLWQSARPTRRTGGRNCCTSSTRTASHQVQNTSNCYPSLIQTEWCPGESFSIFQCSYKQNQTPPLSAFPSSV